ncbi:MAG TPA: insulinase family protein [Spirochaetales bacterium]|nr:insulinase family protein [Spirochaetales bacterium]
MRVAGKYLYLVIVTVLILSSCVGSPGQAPQSDQSTQGAAPAASNNSGSAPQASTLPSTLPGGTGYALSDPLPLAPELTKEVLPNGLTLYVRANGNPGGRAIMYLVVAGGSSVERDDELGYAHFVEHMAFNGTKSFPENELVTYMRSIGMAFGAEVNAYTAREETLYSLEVPSRDSQTLATGLKILREWAQDISFDPVEVEKEKGVILEERRASLGPDGDALAREMPVLLAGSRHALRDPIGTEESIRGATAERLRAFYQRSYRPEHMAVIIVGDINPAAIASAVESEFTFTNADGIRQERTLFPVQASKGMGFTATFRPDFRSSIVHYEKIVPYQPEVVIGDYIELLKIRIAAEAIKIRLADLSRTGDKAWREAYFDDDYFFGLTRLYAFSIATQEGKEASGFADLAVEVERLRLHGLTNSEFTRTVEAWRKWLSTLNYEDQDLKSRSFADEYTRNFMYGEPVPGIINERVYIKRTLDSISLEDMNAACRLILGADEGFVAVRAKAASPIDSINESAFAKILADARAMKPAMLETRGSVMGLFDSMPEPGTVSFETKHPNGITQLTLSNGATVLLKPTSYDNDAITFAAWSPGGYASMPVSRYYAASFADTLLAASGLGALDAVRLEELTAGKSVGVGWTISESAEYLYGKTTTADLETFMRMVYLNAAEQGRDAGSFYVQRKRFMDQLDSMAGQSDYLFQSRSMSHLYGNNPRLKPITSDDIASLEFDQVRDLVHAQFACASDFTYIFVGDFNLGVARDLAAKYIGAIPSGSPSSVQWVEALRPRSGPAERLDIAVGTEERSSVRMIWAGESEWSWQREESLGLLAIALNNRLLDALREDLGGTYVVNVESAFQKLPVQQFSLTVSFDCAPDRADELIAKVQEEIASFLNGTMDSRYADQARVLAQRSYDGRLRTNDLWLNEMLRSVSLGLNFEIPARARETILLASYDKLQALATELIKPERLFVYVLKPARIQ